LRLARKFTALLSVILLILVAGVSFNYLRSRPEYPPPAILDPAFDLWVSDRESGQKRPLVWELDSVKGVGDQVMLEETVLAGKTTLEIRVFEDGFDEVGVYVRLKQMIDGARLRAFLDSEVGVWVFLESSSKEQSDSPSTIFGVQTNDGLNMLTFIFSEEASHPQQAPGSRTVFLATPSGRWAYQRIDVAGEYKDAHWKKPERLSFGVTLGAQASAPGWHVGYVHRFVVETPTSAGLTGQEEFIGTASLARSLEPPRIRDSRIGRQ